jgi:IclR family acetate operon transcriptional repressor
MATTRSASTGTLLTLDRGIRVLEEIARANGFSTARSIGATLGINQGTVYQILRTLQDSGYVHRQPGGRYQLGTRVAYLVDGYRVQAAPPQVIIDYLHTLHHATDETVCAVLALGSVISIVSTHESTKRLRVGSSEVGQVAFPHATAAGKAFLAFCDAEELDDYFDDHKLAAATPSTITNWDDLLEELDATRDRGLAFEREESDLGVAGVGAVIIGSRGEPVGAYSATMPATRLADSIDSVSTAVLKAGDAASRALGYRGDYPPKEPRSRHRNANKPYVSR